MARSLFSMAFGVVLFLSGSLSFGADHSLDEFKQAGAAVCIWEPGKAKESVKAVEQLGFQVVYRSPYLSGITCRWKGPLTEQMLGGLKQIPSLKTVEPAPEIFLTDDKPVERAVTGQTLDAYQWAGAMTCVWKTGCKKKAIELVEGQKLKVVYQSFSQPAITCKWDVTKEVLEALKQSESLNYVEPAPSPELIKAAEGRTIELAQGTPTISRSGDRLG